MKLQKSTCFEGWLFSKDPQCDLSFTYTDPKVQLAWEAWQECERRETEYYNNKDKPHGPAWPFEFTGVWPGP